MQVTGSGCIKDMCWRAEGALQLGGRVLEEVTEEKLDFSILQRCLSSVLVSQPPPMATMEWHRMGNFEVLLTV